MLHVGSPPAAYQGSQFSRMPPILRWTPPPFAQQSHWGLCTTNTYTQPPPIACIPFPSPVKMTVQVKNWF